MPTAAGPEKNACSGPDNHDFRLTGVENVYYCVDCGKKRVVLSLDYRAFGSRLSA